MSTNPSSVLSEGSSSLCIPWPAVGAPQCDCIDNAIILEGFWFVVLYTISEERARVKFKNLVMITISKAILTLIAKQLLNLL